MKGFLRCLFAGVSNEHWDLGRILAAKAVIAYIAAFLYAAFWLHHELEYASVGTGLAAVLAGAGALIWAKDSARAKALETAGDGAP